MGIRLETGSYRRYVNQIVRLYDYQLRVKHSVSLSRSYDVELRALCDYVFQISPVPICVGGIFIATVVVYFQFAGSGTVSSSIYIGIVHGLYHYAHILAEQVLGLFLLVRRKDCRQVGRSVDGIYQRYELTYGLHIVHEVRV